MIGAAAISTAAVSLLAVLPWYVRRTVTDATAQRRFVEVVGDGEDSRGKYLEFTRGSFADHPGQLSIKAASGGSLIALDAPVLGNPTRRYVVHGDSGRVANDQRGQLSGFMGETPLDFGLMYADVDIDGRPAWEISPEDPSSDVWVIHVHGLGSSRQQCLRAISVFERLGFTSLVPTYSTSLDLGDQAAHRSSLGTTEWRDVAAAVTYATSRGASRVLFVGWSLGASIVLRAAREVTAVPTVGAVLVSPALDWPDIIDSALKQWHLPAWLRVWTVTAFDVFRWPSFPRIDLRRLPGVSSDNDPTFPTLVFHGSADASVPVESSRRYATRNPTSVSYVEFDRAHHTLEWNSAPEEWAQAVQDWCRSIGLTQDKKTLVHTLEAK
ncbi:alpha/beta fold hydrolase (plasmid) [Arthrobacter agilis]|uniref:alpha/beta hydrolase n=1 Tax=Arthrobacter agilis TaxID=37921 RepID=UPI002365E112|nr:alpha/beta fold hydrolase [Arthrobacter agilis]WDF35048.1 alpha/beta fold hydrolase [Arthrobacter agilis]